MFVPTGQRIRAREQRHIPGRVHHHGHHNRAGYRGVAGGIRPGWRVHTSSVVHGRRQRRGCGGNVQRRLSGCVRSANLSHVPRSLIRGWLVAQYSTDTDLINALAAPHVRINGKLEFDWYRNGSYSAPYGSADYGDLSKLLQKVEIESSTVVGDIPDAVNVVVGSSSGQMTVTLAGRRNAEEYTALQLFSKYFVSNNPL